MKKFLVSKLSESLIRLGKCSHSIKATMLETGSEDGRDYNVEIVFREFQGNKMVEVLRVNETMTGCSDSDDAIEKFFLVGPLGIIYLLLR